MFERVNKYDDPSGLSHTSALFIFQYYGKLKVNIIYINILFTNNGLRNRIMRTMNFNKWTKLNWNNLI